MKIRTPDGFDLDMEYKKVSGDRVVIMAHGMTVDKDGESAHLLAEPSLNRSGISTIRFDFRACGKSDGIEEKDFNTIGWLTDLTAVVEFARKQKFRKIDLSAASFGASIACLYVGQRQMKVNSLVLLYPVLDHDFCFIHPKTKWAMAYFSNIKNIIAEQGFALVGSRKYRVGIAWYEQLKFYKPYLMLAEYSGPILALHGDLDEHVPYKDTLTIFSKIPNFNKRFITVNGAGHGFEDEKHAMLAANEIVDFIVKN